MYLRKAIKRGFVYGIIFGFLFAYKNTVPAGIVAGILFALIYFTFYLNLANLHIRAVTKKSRGGACDVTQLCHERRSELNISYNEAFNLCLNSLTLFKRPKILKKDYEKGEIAANIKGSFMVSDQKIEFYLVKQEDKTLVRYLSRPLSGDIDFGKNLDNVEAINSFFKAYC